MNCFKSIKSLAITSSVVLLSYVVNPQKTFNVEFNNGIKKKKKITYQNDPNRISKWEVKIFPITIGELSENFFGIQILPKYRINKKFEVEGRFLAPYASATDGHTSTTFKDFVKPFLEIGATGHYAIFRKTTEKEKDVSVDYEGGSLPDELLVYKVKLPVKKQYALMGDIGFGYSRFSPGFEYTIPDPSNDSYTIKYFGGHVGSFAMNVGASLQMIKSYKVKADYASRSYIRIGTLSASLSYGIANSYAIYEYRGFGVNQFTDKTSEHTDLSYNAIGWRVGFDQKLGIKNTGAGLLYGIELGGLPSYSAKNLTTGEKIESNPLFFALKFGGSLGSNPWR